MLLLDTFVSSSNEKNELQFTNLSVLVVKSEVFVKLEENLAMVIWSNEYAYIEKEFGDDLALTIKSGVTTLDLKIWDDNIWATDMWIFINTHLKNVFISDSVEEINEGALDWLDRIEELLIPDTVKTIGRKALFLMPKLEDIDLSKNLTSIGVGAFSGCGRLKKIQLPEGLMEIGYKAFAACSKLQTVEIPRTVMTLGADVFVDCKSLKEIIVSENLLKRYGSSYIKSLTDARIVISEEVHSEDIFTKGNTVSSVNNLKSNVPTMKSYTGVLRKNVIVNKKKTQK